MKLGVIGYGSRIQDVIREITNQDPSCEIAAIVDIRKGTHSIPVLDSVEALIKDVKPDGILIGTRCSLHTEMALKVLPTRTPLYLEKPVSTTMNDLRRLKQGYEAAQMSNKQPQFQPKSLSQSQPQSQPQPQSQSQPQSQPQPQSQSQSQSQPQPQSQSQPQSLSQAPVIVSFPLRVTSIVKLVKEIVDSGKIGTVEHVQATNNVPYGGVYFHNWYRDENETGGLFLQKATHDFDYINHVLQQKPAQVCAMTSKQIFKGDKPAGLKCVECDENKLCAESTAFDESEIRDSWQYCCFAKDTGNEDSGSALIRYESGMHVSYSQNFFARRQAAVRGARFLGYKGTLEFDFYTGHIKVYMHHTPRVETYEIEKGLAHFGGDAALAGNFIDMMYKRGQSICPLEEGLQSALLCLKARESAETGSFRMINWEI